MQTIFLQFRKIFSGAGSKLAKSPRIASRIRKKRAAATTRHFGQSRFRPLPVLPCTLTGYLPDKRQSQAPEMPIRFPAQISCQPRLSFWDAAAAKNRTMPPIQPLARKLPRIARQLFPAGSTKQAAHPAAALTGFFIAKSGYRSLYCHLPPIY